VGHLATPRFPALKREHKLVGALDFVFGLQKFFTPWFAHAFGALVDGVANREAVIAGSIRTVARKLLTFLAGFEKRAIELSMLFPEFVFTNDAHSLLLTHENNSSSVANVTPPPCSTGCKSGSIPPRL
jgi:hypothetical protein